MAYKQPDYQRWCVFLEATRLGTITIDKNKRLFPQLAKYIAQETGVKVEEISNGGSQLVLVEVSHVYVFEDQKLVVHTQELRTPLGVAQAVSDPFNRKLHR